SKLASFSLPHFSTASLRASALALVRCLFKCYGRAFCTPLTMSLSKEEVDKNRIDTVNVIPTPTPVRKDSSPTLSWMRDWHWRIASYPLSWFGLNRQQFTEARLDSPYASSSLPASMLHPGKRFGIAPVESMLLCTTGRKNCGLSSTETRVIACRASQVGDLGPQILSVLTNFQVPRRTEISMYDTIAKMETGWTITKAALP
ncbi:hypothetical protein BDP27DRAFT_1501771, partial [Rhodocollybia butyracea]